MPLVFVVSLQRLPQLDREPGVFAGALRLPLELRQARRDLLHQKLHSLDVLVRGL